SRTPIAVVCAGAKAVLDLPRTMEVLETLGVPVVGLRADEFPAFYSTGSGLELEHSMESEAEVARAVHEHWSLGLETAVLVCNPPPDDAALDPAKVSGWIEAALSDADTAGVTGKRLTPWLLAALARASGGATVETNIALLESNVRAAARLAVEMRRGRSTRVGGF
ncbi:MAG: pseudouridine-5'-phosphate glycosidase, partial [Gemmatimonadota bacterium]|nr:pseudouridine-5'-phosphate glycosidase [Gemmatimonadota bacterium]